MSKPTCGCDVCLDVIGPGDAVTREGYCGFCARHCFPWVESGPWPGRQTLTLESRQELHRVWDAYGTLDPDLVNQRAAVQVGLSVAQSAAPMIAPHVRNLFKVLGKKLR